MNQLSKRMNGKEKCNILRLVRKDIAKTNGIEWNEDECTFQEDCIGTCPKCENALQRLEQLIMAKKGEKSLVESLSAYYNNINLLDNDIQGDVQVIDDYE